MPSRSISFGGNVVSLSRGDQYISYSDQVSRLRRMCKYHNLKELSWHFLTCNENLLSDEDKALSQEDAEAIVQSWILAEKI